MKSSGASDLLLIDSDVLIDYLRDLPQAVAFLEGSEQPLAASVITVAELYAGVREGEERQRLDSFFAAFTVLPLDQQLARRAGLWRRQYAPSHGTGLADGCPDRRQRGGRRRHPADPQSTPLPDARGGAGALCKGLNGRRYDLAAYSITAAALAAGGATGRRNRRVGVERAHGRQPHGRVQS
jgi:hypothetical protein